MRPHLLFLVLLTAVSFLIVPEPGSAQPECVEVWFILEGAGDPPCRLEPEPWAIEVTTTIIATSTLSGRYLIIDQVGTCFKVCKLCP